MSLWAIVPVKPLRKGKSRLANILPEEERALLNYQLLTNTLTALKSVHGIDQVLVVSRDTAVLSLAREYGYKTLQEDDESSDLNLTLSRATVVAQYYGATSLLIIPADLPLLKPSHIQSILRDARGSPLMVIVPDRHREGTNLLYIAPPGLVEYRYGAHSFQAHLDEARKHQIPVVTIEIESVMLDLDVPEDLEELSKVHNIAPFSS